ncbi:sensor histidine kinase [Kribbella albertanoniae]|uniref:Oxygen sensor histidine kinase NreB n=1 Tax=Kribbella albertanoniae TaxID=1266829 RepID=A0A4R4P3E6_9ACTN|nr:sensor histidine kinase [Kribbella albertanoniae]TDC15157.1 sensor histidine kinase [Kribbella albertanoniae]
MDTMEATTTREDQVMGARTLLGWNIVFWVLLTMTLAVSVTSELSTSHRWIVAGAIVLLGTAYQFIGRPAIESRRFVPSLIYRLVLIGCLMVLVGLSPTSVFMMFILSAQVWLLSETLRDGIGFSLALVAGCGTAQLWSAGWGWDALWQILPWMMVSLVVSLLFGIWISRVITESHQRAVLIEELRATRDELAEAHHSAGVMAERERMAREIHDTLAQGMTSIVMLSQTGAAELARGSDGVAARLAQIEATARENLAEARALVAAFTPVALSEATLTEVLRRQGDRFAAETGVDVQVLLDLDESEVVALPQSQQVVLLRVAQEALANIRKHARATSVLITLGVSAGRVCIEIRDDGSGFSVAEPSTGFGLAAMRGRVEESGGTVQVESSPGHGTTVQVLIPVQESA